MPPRKKKSVDLKQKRVDTMLKSQSNVAEELPRNEEAPSSSTKKPNKYDNPDFPVNFETFYANTNVRDFAIEEIKYNKPDTYEHYLTDHWIVGMARKFYQCYYTRKESRQLKPLMFLKISPQCPAEIREAIKSFPNGETQTKAMKRHISKQIVDSTKAIQSHIERFPLTFGAFKKFTFWEEIIDVIVDYYTEGDLAKFTAIKEDKGKCEQIIHNYYYCYYARPEVRKDFHIRFKAVPSHLKEKLLHVPTEAELNGEAPSTERSVLKESDHHSPGDVPANATDNNTPKSSSGQASPKPQEKAIVDGFPDPKYIESKNIVETSALCERTMEKFPVTLKVFRNSTAWQDTVKSIVSTYTRFDEAKCVAYTSNVEECQRILRNLYYHFYTRPEIRNMFPLRLKPMPTHCKVKLLSIPMLEDEEDPTKRTTEDDAASTESYETSTSVYITAPSSEFNDSHDTRMETPPGDADEAPPASPTTFVNKPKNNRSNRPSMETDAADDRQHSDEPQRVQIQSVQIIVPPKHVAASRQQSPKATPQKTSTAVPKQPGQVASPEKVSVQTPGFLSNRRSEETPNPRLIAAVEPRVSTNKSLAEATKDQGDETADDVYELDADLIRQWESEEQENLEDSPHLWPSILTFAKGCQNPATWPYLTKITVGPNTKGNSREHTKNNESVPAALAAPAGCHQVDVTRIQMDTTSIRMDATSNQMDATSNQMDATSNKMDATSNQMDATSNQMDATSNQMDATSNQMDATSNQMDATSNQMGATKNQMDTTSNQMDATSIKIDDTSIQIDDTSIQMDATSNQMDGTSNQMDATSIQIDATSVLMDATSIQIDDTSNQLASLTFEPTQNPLERTHIPESKQSNAFTATPSHFVSFANTQMQMEALPGESLPSGDPLVSPQLQDANFLGNPKTGDLAATPIKTEKAEKPLKNVKFILDDTEDTFVCEPIRESEEVISILDETGDGINLTDELMKVPSTLNNL